MSCGFRRFAVGVYLLVGFAWAQSEGVQPLEPKEAFAIFKALNEQKKLIESVFAKVWSYKVQPENCFGLKLPGGARLAGESAGDDYGGLAFTEGSWVPQIGFMFSETAFTLQDQAFQKGIHRVFASAGSLTLRREDSSISLALPSRIDAALLEAKSRRPKFSFAVDGGQVFLVVANNKLALKPAQTPQQ